MHISETLARNIVNSIKDILNREINYINKKGIIIASTDETRIGTIHEGARRVLNTQAEVFISKDHQYIGAKNGINVPVYFEQNIVGIIGLTGGEDVRQYAGVLKKMTEILIKEAYIKDFSFRRREMNRLTIDSLLLSPDDLSQDNLLRFDFSTSYQVVVGSFSSRPTSEKLNLFLQLLESEFSPTPQILFTVNHQQTIIVFNKMTKEEVFSLLARIQKKAAATYDLSLNFGIGLQGNSQEDLRQSFIHAKEATEWLDYQHAVKEIAFFEDLNLGILIPAIPEERIRYFTERILGSISQEDLALFKATLESFSKHNGSIQKSADELFIHKNTFQYRLNKMKKLTGRDPRNYNDFAILKMAFLLESGR